MMIILVSCDSPCLLYALIDAEIPYRGAMLVWYTSSNQRFQFRLKWENSNVVTTLFTTYISTYTFQLFFVSDRNYVPFDICIVNCLHKNRFSSFSNMFSSTRFVYTQSAIKFVVSEKITLILLFTRTFQKKTFVLETNN